MTAVSNIFSAIIVIALLLTIVIIVQVSESKHFDDTFVANQTVFEQKKAAADLDSVLAITEPTTKMSLIDLISSMIYYRKHDFDLPDASIDARATIENVFDSVFGKQNYYLKAEQRLSNVRLFFLIDGSLSMQEDVEKISRVLPDMENILRAKKMTVQTRIFIGSNATKDINCKSFVGYDCVELDEFNIYKDFPDLKTGGKYALGYELNPSSSLVGDHYEDWATMSIIAAKGCDPKRIEDGTITILFPVSDELSTGSEPDYCYRTGFPSGGFGSKNHCLVCITDNGYARSKKTIDHALEKIAGLDYLVLPILVSSCQLPESIWSKMLVCGASCGGCPVDAGTNTACYHPEVFNDTNNSIKGQMLYFSTQRNGADKAEVLDLSGGYSQEELENQLTSVLSKFVFYSFEIGTKKEDAEKLSIKRVLPLRGRTISEVTFWSYLEKENFSLKEAQPALGLKPVALIDLTKDTTDPYKIFADGSASYDPEGGALSFEWHIDGDTAIASTNPSFTKTFIAGQEGEHTFQLTVRNPALLEGSAEKSICVGPDSFCNPGPTKRFFIVATEFSLGDAEFNNYASRHWNNFVSNLSCPARLQEIVITPGMFSDPSKGCEVPELSNCMSNAEAQTVLSRIDSCVANAGYILTQDDRILGITNTDIRIMSGGVCVSNVIGYTMGLGTENTVISEHSIAETSTHEAGHTFELCDEYSLHEWTRQNASHPLGQCVNDYPIECTVYNPELCNDADTTCEHAETYLNCPKPTYDCDAPGADCGDDVCQAGETPGSCPRDCMKIDCFGTTYSLTPKRHSVMGPGNADGFIDGIINTREYENKGKTHINSVICN